MPLLDCHVSPRIQALFSAIFEEGRLVIISGKLFLIQKRRLAFIY